MSVFLVLIGILPTGGCVSILDEGDAITRVPYSQRPDGQITIEVSINGRGPLVFALDSAASISAVSQHVVNDLDLPMIEGKRVFVHGAVSSGELDLARLDTLAYGSEQKQSLAVAVLQDTSRSLPGIDGILGLDVLKAYSVGFSSREKTLLLYEQDTLADRGFSDWANVPMSERPIGDTGAFVYSIGIWIKGQRILALFDLGSEVNLVNSVAARRVGVRINTDAGDDLHGALDSTPVQATLLISEVATHGVIWKNEDFSVADLPVFERFGLSRRPAAMVGATLFTQRDFIIDFPRSRLLIRKSGREIDPPD